MIFTCFRTHFEVEEQIQLLKQKMTRRPRFNPRDCFQFLDCLDHGVLTMISFRKVMNDKKCFPSDDELMLLINRFDRNKNGQVSY